MCKGPVGERIIDGQFGSAHYITTQLLPGSGIRYKPRAGVVADMSLIFRLG